MSDHINGPHRCIWGLVTLVARNENPYVVAVMICLGIIPSAYVQLGTPYPKAGMVSIVSMCVVALSTELGSVPGTSQSPSISV